MKLVELRITNFRSLGGSKNIIKFKDIDVIILVGQNNVGKSSTLKAYEFFINPKQTASKQDFFDYDTNNPIIIEGDFLKEPEDENDKELSKEPDWVNKWVQKETGLITIEKKWEKEGKPFSKRTKNESGKFEKGGFGGLNQIFSKYTPTPIFINAIETTENLEKQVNLILERKHLKELEASHKKEYDAAINAIRDIQHCITSSAEVDEYNSNINASFQKIFPALELKISIRDEDKGIDILKAFKTNHSIDVLKQGTERKETFAQHGHGIVRQALFNFLTFMKNEVQETNKKEYLLLFEEPELYLHPTTIKLLREELYRLAENSPFQILCCTHNPQLIDISKPHSSIIRLVKNPTDETTETYQVGYDIFGSQENKNYIQMVNRFNPDVCQVFYADNVIIVEGDTEAIICRELLQEYGSEHEIFVLNSGSKTNIPFFQRILNHFKIPYTIIHDSDTRYVYENRGTGQVKYKKDGEPKKLSSWKLNEEIWTEIENGIDNDNIVHRLVSVYDFESKNKYEVNTNDGKPLSAYKFIQKHKKSKELPICKFISEILKNSYSKEWNQQDIENIEEPYKKKQIYTAKNNSQNLVLF
ncbi:AAA family ATPase [Candidatus Halobeggiatoa sp. HSG11]|nr:AAA family ATPase [Candidatus Halobeggiatoa sp. HSG11]